MRYFTLLLICLYLLIGNTSFCEKGNEKNPITLIINTKSPSSESSNDGKITADISGGTAPYEIRIMGPDQNHKSYNNHLEIKNLKKGDYLFIIRDKDGKIKHQEIQL